MKKPFLYSITASIIITAGNSYALEPFVESKDSYTATYFKRVMANLDKNTDGQLQAEENEKLWKKNKHHDLNKDNVLDQEEFKNVTRGYIDHKGEKVLDVLYKKTEEEDLYLDFYYPDVDDNKKKPVVIYTHGGGWAAGNKHAAGKASFAVVHKKLLEKGFCVVSVNYRLCKKNTKVAMRDCVVDAKDAIRFISAHSETIGIDPTKIYTFGDSAGGHISQMLLLSTPESFTGDPELAKYTYQTVAGVSWYGPCDFQDSQLFNHDDRENFRDRFGPRILGANKNPEDKAKLYTEVSPVEYLTEDSPPLLMIQGDKDTSIPVKQAHRMEQALETIKAPVEISIVKNAGHNWRKVDADIEPSRDEIVDNTVNFLLKHFK